MFCANDGFMCLQRPQEADRFLLVCTVSVLPEAFAESFQGWKAENNIVLLWNFYVPVPSYARRSAPTSPIGDHRTDTLQRPDEPASPTNHCGRYRDDTSRHSHRIRGGVGSGLDWNFCIQADTVNKNIIRRDNPRFSIWDRAGDQTSNLSLHLLIHSYPELTAPGSAPG